MKKILVFSMGGLGDVVNSLPAIQRLSKKGLITVVVKNDTAKKIVETEKKIKSTHVFPSDTDNFTFKKYVLAKSKTAKEARKLLVELKKEAFDESYWFAPYEGQSSGVISKLAGAKKRYGFYYTLAGKKSKIGFNKAIVLDETKHFVEININLVEIEHKDQKTKISKPKVSLIGDLARQASAKYPKSKKRIGIHPGGDPQSPVKIFPAKKMAEVINLISDSKKAEIFLFVGPQDAKIYQNIKKTLKHKVNIVKKPILETAAIIKTCDVFLSSDSGLGHIANALNVPVIALFGPANPKQTRPYGSKNEVINIHEPCSPCIGTYMYSNCPFNRRCLHKIPESYIVERLLLKLKKRKSK